MKKLNPIAMTSIVLGILTVAVVAPAVARPHAAAAANTCITNRIRRDGLQPISGIQSIVFGGNLQWQMTASNESIYQIHDGDLCLDRFVIVPARKRGVTATCKCFSFGPPGCARQNTATASGPAFHAACASACDLCFQALPGRGTDGDSVCSHNSRGC
jgi:hypothetical protein